MRKTMQSKKITPIEILQKQKAGLQAKSDELGATIEKRARFVQQNFIPLLRNSIMESAVSKLPPQLRNFAGNLLQKEKKTNIQDLSPLHKIVQGIAAGIAEIAPFFLKGKKGALISVLLRQVIKWV